MPAYSRVTSKPIDLPLASLSTVWWLLSLSFLATALGTGAALLFAPIVLSGPGMILFVILEFLLLLTSSYWVKMNGWNIVMFFAFPFLSGITAAPVLLYTLGAYVNGPSILLNTMLATVTMTMGAGVVAKLTGWDLRGIGGFLFMSLIGLIVFSIIQVFVPSLSTVGIDTVFSGISILVFSGFCAYDIQLADDRLRAGISPLLVALTLYLDIFNLFLYLLRFISAVSGERR